MDAFGFFYLIASLLCGTLVTGAYAVIALNPADYKQSKNLFRLAGLAAILIVVVWIISADTKLILHFLIGAFGVVFVILLTVIAIKWVNARENLIVDIEPIQHNAIFDSQFDELKELDEMVCRKTEFDLRELFDFSNILKYNVLFQARRLSRSSVNLQTSEEINKFFIGGQARTNVKYIMSSKTNKNHVEFLPGKIGFINTSIKYNLNRKKISEFLASPKLPSEVLKELTFFDQALEANSNLMLEVINEELSKGEARIIESFKANSRWFGGVNNTFMARFDPLQPKAEMIRNAIRTHLKVA